MRRVTAITTKLSLAAHICFSLNILNRRLTEYALFLTQAQTAEAFRLYFLSLAALVLAVLIFTGGFASARFYMEAGGGPQDVVTLRHGISGLLFLPFVVWIWERLREHPGLWRAIGLAIRPWVVNEPRHWEMCLAAGVDGAITDDPAGLSRYLLGNQ